MTASPLVEGLAAVFVVAIGFFGHHVRMYRRYGAVASASENLPRARKHARAAMIWGGLGSVVAVAILALAALTATT
jgi:hypothetical protein